MQTFLPYPTFEFTAKTLDWRRLGKQRVEGMQIINAIENPNKQGWQNHPIVIMWKPYVNALKHYTNIMIDEWVSRGYNNTMKKYDVYDSDIIYPAWLRYEPFHASHRANLLRKDYKYYSHFAWVEDPESPYVWLDADNTRWYEQVTGTKGRIYL